MVQFVNLEFSPGEFEEHVLGCKQDWRQSLLVEVGQQSQNGLQQALPLGPWLHQQGISVDDEGRMLSSAQPSRFAQEAALEAQPSLSGPPAHCPARSSSTACCLGCIQQEYIVDPLGLTSLASLDLVCSAWGIACCMRSAHIVCCGCKESSPLSLLQLQAGGASPFCNCAYCTRPW